MPFLSDERIECWEDPADRRPRRAERSVQYADQVAHRHQREDRPRREAEAAVDAAIRRLKTGRRVLPVEQFEALVLYMFADFPRQAREALRVGKIRMGDGTNVTRGEAKAEAA